MQNRYVGDIGDYAKYALLRALSPGYRLGVAWYLYPDEGHNADGKHVSYLSAPDKWRGYDPALFDSMKKMVESGQRSVNAVRRAGVLPGAAFSEEPLVSPGQGLAVRRQWRVDWFDKLRNDLGKSSIVFADPDNGLCSDEKFSYGRLKDWKRLPLSEALALSQDRTGILYHHNSRWPGGHLAEIQYWLARLDGPSLALRWRAYSPRTFFVVNFDDVILDRVEKLAERWAPHFELVKG